MLDLMARELQLLDEVFSFYKLKSNTYFKEYLQPLFQNSRLYETLNGLVTRRCAWIWYRPSWRAISIFMGLDLCM